MTTEHSTTTPTVPRHDRADPGAAPPPDPPPVPVARREPSRSGALSLGILLVGAGLVWLLAALGVDLPVTLLAPLLLVVIGTGVLVAGVRGEDNVVVGLAVFLGVWLAIAGTASALLSVPLAGAVGDRELVPSAVTELEDGSRLFAGEQVLDLTMVELPAGTTDVELSVVMGQVHVIVPADMAVEVDAAVAAGAVDILGERTDGMGIRDEQTTPGWSDATNRVSLHLRVGLGEVIVRTP